MGLDVTAGDKTTGQERGMWHPEAQQDKLHHEGDRSGEHPPDTEDIEGSQHTGAPGTPAPGWNWGGLRDRGLAGGDCLHHGPWSNSACRMGTVLH